METETIDPKKEPTKNKKKLKTGAAIVGGVGAAAGAGAVIYGVVTEEDGESIVQAESVQNEPSETMTSTESDPVETDDATSAAIDPTEHGPIVDNEVVEEPEPIDNSQANPTLQEDIVMVNDEDLVDVIAPIEEVDPNDIETESIINVDQVETVYTPNGEELLVATIHDDDGNTLHMVDVDGDEVFDVIATPSGIPIAPVQGNISGSDAESMINSGDPTYLAATGDDVSTDIVNEMQNDILSM